MRFRSFESILDECLAAVHQGEAIEDCLARYPRQAERLRPLLQLASRLGTALVPTARPVARATAWSLVRQRAGSLRSSRRRGLGLPAVSYSAWLRPAAIILAVFFALGAVTSGTTLAAQDSLPDSPLYRVKLATEDVHLWLVFDEQHEAEILLDQSAERTAEIRELVQKRQEVPGIVLSALQDRNERAAAIVVANPDAFKLRDRLKSQALDQEHLLVSILPDVKESAGDDYSEALAAVHNTYWVGSESFYTPLLPEDIGGGVLKISGVPELGEGGRWTLGGVPVGIDQRTIGLGDIKSGSSADFVIAIGPGGRWQALSISRIDTELPAIVSEIQGEIESVEDDHIVIGGQAIPITGETIIKLKLKKGASVTVKLDHSATGVVADTVAANGESRGVDSTKLTYEGTIERDLSEATDLLTVGGRDFALTELTNYDFRAGPPVAGARARIHAGVNEDGELEAQDIAVLAADDADDEVYLTGTFEGALPGSSSWKVSGLQLDPPPGNNELDQGSVIFLEARLVNGFLVASRYQVVQSPDTGKLVRLEGMVTTIDDAIWDMGFGAVRVGSTAEVSGKPLAGTRAIVWGRTDSDSGLFDAVFVRVLDQRPIVTQPTDPQPEG